MVRLYPCFFFNDTATTEIYTLSLHDALPISIALEGSVRGAHPTEARRARPRRAGLALRPRPRGGSRARHSPRGPTRDRKSTRLNSSHANISYAVFCLKKKKENGPTVTQLIHI